MKLNFQFSTFNFQHKLLSLPKYLLALFLAFSGISCNVKHNDTAKIRAKIINPRTDEVVISRDFLLLQSDTLKLNSQNELSGTVKVPEEGLYILFIFPEFQTIYLKPGDSLAFHLNADEFDESISFSGSLAFENNLLMEMFLANEQEKDYFYKHRFEFDLSNFIKKLDSFETKKNKLLESYKDEYRKTTSKYKQILTLVKKSAYYNLKEYYALRNLNNTFPEDYFAYRSVFHKKLPDPNIFYLNTFVDALLKYKMKKNDKKVRNPYLKLAYLINHEIFDTVFRDNLLTKYCIRYINAYHISKKDTVVKDFYFKIINEKYKKYCEEMIADNQLVRVGKRFPENTYLTLQNTKISSDSLFKTGTKTLVAFHDFRFRKNLVSNLKKIKKYNEQYPDLQYVIISIKNEQSDEWQMPSPEEKNILFVRAENNRLIQRIRPYSLAQIYLLDGQTIKASKVNMYAPGFERKLQELINEE